MNKHLFNPELKGNKLSAALSLLSTIEFVLGIILSILTFLGCFVVGIILVAEANSVGGFFLMFFMGALGAGSVFLLGYASSLLFKALASITLHTYINALNSEIVAESIIHKKAE